MAEAISESISFFRSQLENRRFGDATLRILESVLVSKDVLSLLETRSALRYLLRSEAISVVREISQKTADEKLCAVEFFVQAFALVGDVESCLALKYEALVLRETKYLKGHGLQVLHEEWLTFAKDSLDNGFYAIAVKGFESALMCIQSNNNIDPVTVTMEEHAVNKIKKLRDMATALVASHSGHSSTPCARTRRPLSDLAETSSNKMYQEGGSILTNLLSFGHCGSIKQDKIAAVLGQTSHLNCGASSLLGMNSKNPYILILNNWDETRWI